MKLTWTIGLLLPVLAGCGLVVTPKPAAEAVAVADEPAKEKVPEGGGFGMFGGTIARNLVNLNEKGILDDFAIEEKRNDKVVTAARNVKWIAKTGNKAYGGPVIAGGRIFIGTNNERPRDPKVKGDKGVVMCFRESDGKFLWQAVHDKLAGGEDNDFPREGIASNPAVEGDRLYYVNNRAEVVCADVAGDEATGKAKILWTYDMIGELGVFPCQLAACSPLIVGDNLYVITGNGVEAGTGKLPAPKAPSFICVNKKTGKLVWKSDLGSAETVRGQWSNPAAAVVDGTTQILFPGGDGYMYGLDAKNGELMWKFDCNPKGATPYKPGGGGQKCFIIATPVVHDNKCYIGVGQEVDTDGPGVGHLWCIDITRKPANKDRDISPYSDPKDPNPKFDPKDPKNKDSGLVWHYGGAIVPPPADGSEFVFGRTIATVAIHDGLLYATELAGYLHCVDARTGAKVWVHDFNESTWCSPYYVDGKVYVGTESGDLYIFRAGKKADLIRKIKMGGAVKVPVLAHNGVLYVNNGSSVIAFAAKK